jgi:trimeric autotransporter adhesin
VAVDSAGNLYIADSQNHMVRKVTTTGIISTVAGNETEGYSGDGGLATAAQLKNPTGVAVDSAGNLYILSGSRIRKVTAAGIISKVAGGGTGDLGDGGPATASNLGNPTDVAVDSAGNLYIADAYANRIRQVTTAGVISTVAGNGTSGYSGDEGPATAAQLSSTGVAIDSAGNLYIADKGNNRIRKVTPAGIISTVAGNGNQGYSGDGGPATAAQLNFPAGVAVDASGNLYLADVYNYRIRKITTEGIISTVAGNGTSGYSGDGGLATAAQLYYLDNVAVDAAGNLYITAYDRVRQVTPAGIINTVAGGGAGALGDGGPATAANLGRPDGVAVDSVGNLYIAKGNRILKVTAAGIISTVAGSDISGYSGDGGPATEAQLAGASGVAIDSAGNLYIADRGNQRIRKVTAEGIISTVAGNGTFGFSGDGGLAIEAQLSYPYGAAVDSAGSLYIGDEANTRIRKVADAFFPTVTTTTISSISQTAASGGGNVISDGGASVTARGVCRSWFANPTTADLCTSNGVGKGSFASSITGIVASTIYHVRAYATNLVGTAYGSDVTFNTLGPANFQVSAGSSGSYSATVAAGSKAVYNLTATAIDGFSGSVSFACSGLPAAASCSFSPSPLSVSGSSAAPFTVNIATAARSTSAGIIKGVRRFPADTSAPAIILCLTSLTVIATMICMSRQRRISIAFVLMCAVGIAGCGGTKKKTTSTQGTPAGTYSVVLKATSGSISHSANLTLTVK